MATTKITLLSVVRPDSNIAAAYNELKDMKKHKLTVLRDKLKKAGIKKPGVLLFRLGRMLQEHEGKALYFDYAADTVEMHTGSRFVSNRVGRTVRLSALKAKVVAKTKSKSKTVASKSKAKSSNKSSNKSKAVKQVAVAVGASDDDVTSE